MSTAAQSAPGRPQNRLAPFGAADLAFVALLAFGAIIVIVETSGLSFFGDDWDFVVDRRGLSSHALLTPHGPHLSLFPILVYKLILKVFGGGSYLPFRLLAAFDLTLLSYVLGVACRRSWGRWWGLAPVLALVTLGPAGVSTLWSFQVGFAFSVAFGVLALLAVSRRHAWGDAACCGCLIISLGSASQGVGFVVGAAFMVALTGGWQRRAWTVLIPAILYGAWYVTIGHKYGETHLSLWPSALGYSMQTLGVTVAALCGLSSVASTTGTLDPTFAAPIATVVVIAIVAAAWRGWRPQPLFWGAAASAVVVWCAASVSDFAPYGRPPTEPRYLASDAILVLICLSTAVPRPRLLRGHGLVVAAIVLVVVCATNLDQYGQQHRFFRAGARQQQAELGALLLMRSFLPAGYNPGVVDANLVNDSSGQFFSAVSAFGLREDDSSEISRQPEVTRESVDRILGANELSLGEGEQHGTSAPQALQVLGGDPQHASGCLTIGAEPLVISLRSGSITVKTSSQYPSSVSAGRYAYGDGDAIGTIPAASSAVIRVVSDAAPQVPWRLQLTGTGSHVCPAR